MKKLLIAVIAVLALAAFALPISGCRNNCPTDEKAAYISAISEVTCLMLNAEDVRSEELQEDAKDVFKKYCFDPDDEEELNALAEKYKSDQEVQDAIINAGESCQVPSE